MAFFLFRFLHIYTSPPHHTRYKPFPFSPPLRLHPPDPATLVQKPPLEQLPPPATLFILPPLASAHVDALRALVALDVVLDAAALELAERARQVEVARQVERDGAAEGRFEAQADRRALSGRVGAWQLDVGELAAEAFLVDVLGGGGARFAARVGAHHVEDVVEGVELLAQGFAVGGGVVVVILGSEAFGEGVHDAGFRGGRWVGWRDLAGRWCLVDRLWLRWGVSAVAWRVRESSCRHC